MKNLSYIFKNVMTIFLVITFFACEGNKKNIQRLSVTDNAPLAEGKNINLKYTDSGRVVYNLITPELKDYSNFEFGFQEFPKGVEVRFWDEENKKSTITSDYAINFINTELIDLRENVVLRMSDSTVLRAEQLYWDKENQWVFTNKPYQIKFKNGSFNDGARFDSNQDFTNFYSRNNQGVQIIEQEKNNGK